MTVIDDEHATEVGAQPTPLWAPRGPEALAVRTRNSAGDAGKDRHHVADLWQSGWLTTVLRPAGGLDRPALDRLRATLGHVAASTDMVIIDLTAAEVTAPRALAQTMRVPARQLQQAGGCLLVAELGRTTIPVTAFPRGSLPLPAA